MKNVTMKKKATEPSETDLADLETLSKAQLIELFLELKRTEAETDRRIEDANKQLGQLQRQLYEQEQKQSKLRN